MSFRSRPTQSVAEIPAVLTDAELREQIEIGMQAALDVADHFIAVLNRMDGCPPLQDNEEAETRRARPRELRRPSCRSASASSRPALRSRRSR